MEGNEENKERYGIIYKITNTANGKCYIGQTTSKKGFNGRYRSSGEGIERVYKHHKYNRDNGRSYNDHLLRSIEKYGFEAFDVIEEFDIAHSKEKLNDLEKKYIKEFDCINNGYNNTDGGSDGKRSKETCDKISESLKGKYCGENHPMYGKQHTEETKRKMSESLKGKLAGENNPNYGKHHSEYTRRKISESRKGKYCGENNPNYGNHKLAGENSPMYGKHLTEEVRRKISEARKGKYCGENNPMYGKHFTEESRRKISEALKGKFAGENHPRARKVVCLNDNKVFNTGKECAEYYKINVNTLVKICKGNQKSTRTGLVFMYYDEHLQQ